MSREPALDHLLEHTVVEPGVAPLVAGSVATLDHLGRGHGAWGAAGSYAPLNDSTYREHTLFDLASLTKPLFATCLAHWLARNPGYCLDTPLCAWLVGARDTPMANISLGALLSHRAGLQAHVELYAERAAGGDFQREREVKRVLGAVREDAIGTLTPKAVYSDLGYILAGIGWESQAGLPLHRVLERELSHHGIVGIGSAASLNASSPEGHERYVPTEDVPWRGGLIVGEVHDDNAWVLSGTGCSGHAGLFGTLEGVTNFGCALLQTLRGLHPTLDANILKALLRRQDESSLRTGFDGKTASGPSSMGRVLGPETFGHLGFTGTSVWCDPATQLVVVVLSNRVCPSRANLQIRGVRPLLHDALGKRGLELRKAFRDRTFGL